MNPGAIKENTPSAFDDRNINWYQPGEFEHFVYAMLDVDSENRVVDAILKFDP